MFYWRRSIGWGWAKTEYYSIRKALPSVMVAALSLLFKESVGKRVLISVGLIASAYLFLFLLEFCWKSLILAPIHFDQEARERERSLSSEIEMLRTKRRWTPTEQYHLEQAQKSLVRIGPAGRAVLLYLHNHGSLAFSSYNPNMTPPGGMQWEAVRGVLSLLTGENLVTASNRRIGGDMEYTYVISPAKAKVIEAVLYESSS